MEILQSYDSWNRLAENVALGFGGFMVLIGLVYLLRVASIGEAKGKYDFISKYETKVLWVMALAVYLALGFFANSRIVELTPLWIFVRTFSTICMTMIAMVATQNLLNFYYPFFIGKRLKALRYKPRLSPKTGKPMKLLTEDEEDAYLDAGMQAEENLFSVDYDVWKDEETGYVKVEKYSGYLYAVKCPDCDYITFRVAHEEVIKHPDPSSGTPGELLKHYECSYCNYKAVVSVNLTASTSRGSAELDETLKKSSDVS